MQLPNTKFQIGDVGRAALATVKHVKHVVSEIETITCPAGTQVFYNCRTYARTQDFTGTLSEWGDAALNDGSNRLYKMRFREDELAPWEGD